MFSSSLIALYLSMWSIWVHDTEGSISIPLRRIFNFPITVRKIVFFPVECFWHLCQTLSDYVWVGLFLGSAVSPFGLRSCGWLCKPWLPYSFFQDCFCCLGSFDALHEFINFNMDWVFQCHEQEYLLHWCWSSPFSVSVGGYHSLANLQTIEFCVAHCSWSSEVQKSRSDLVGYNSSSAICCL